MLAEYMDRSGMDVTTQDDGGTTMEVEIGAACTAGPVGHRTAPRIFLAKRSGDCFRPG